MRKGRVGLLLGAGCAWVVAAAGVAVYLTSPAHAVHDPQHALQQLDAFSLDEPAPGLGRLGLTSGPAVLLFCEACPAPAVRGASVVRTTDRELARAYSLIGAGGRVGPGYALVDGRGRVRYRTFDPAPAEHLQELQPLVDALAPAP